jgi:magnesium chelatase subunit I
MRIAYPFSAIVGQDEMKLALLLAATDQGIGGVMVFGDRGTGKSTAVRALAALLPPISVAKGCAFHCDPNDRAESCVGGCEGRGPGRAAHGELISTPVVDLPLGATEDRVVGALDLEMALTRGEKRFEPGLLARAHRGFLYIDEVNLLEDHLVDLLLDVAASGENVVEREGLSVRHPARFVLVGSGNPEEGELRPQLLDRFGLSVEVETPSALAERVDVVRRRDAFDRDPEGFVAAWAPADTAIRDQIVAARARGCRGHRPRIGDDVAAVHGDRRRRFAWRADDPARLKSPCRPARRVRGVGKPHPTDRADGAASSPAPQSFGPIRLGGAHRPRDV